MDPSGYLDDIMWYRIFDKFIEIYLFAKDSRLQNLITSYNNNFICHKMDISSSDEKLCYQYISHILNF